MEAIMDSQGIWDSIEPPAGEAVSDKKNKMARAFIFQAVPEDILLQVSKKRTTKEIWEALKTRYLGADRVQRARLHTLKSDFERLRMKEGETIDEFSGNLSAMVSKFNNLGSTIEDNTLVRKILDSVPDMYLLLVASIEQCCDLDTMPFEEAIGRLKAYEDRLKLRSGNTSNEGSLLLTKTNFQKNQNTSGGSWASGRRGRGSYHHAKGGRYGGRDRGDGRGKSEHVNFIQSRDFRYNQHKGRDKRHIKCFNCEKFGHCASEWKSSSNEKNNEINLAQAQEKEPALLLSVYGENTLPKVLLNEDKVLPNQSERDGDDVWYLDNGASNHMTGKQNLFVELNKEIMGQVCFGDGSKVQIEGKGSILLKCKNGEHKVIYEVYYIPPLRSNILSLGQLTEEGYKVEMLNEHLKVHDEHGKLIMKVQRSKNRVYKINLHTIHVMDRN
ncbi:uncharacterized protein LOC127250461 [Andrographis paniculata]|uniref:uncharacterized protein LOC127250461 n=1 Tax=Andrographis paniculata TaxID=175694 RepID=UPI0021E8965A|nr:uncharacterized protein LOC127250461 [Andrographis paniculata]